MRPYQPSILVVADAKELRDAMEQGLTAAGYHVYITDQGRSAVAFLRETADPPDLVIADTELRDLRAIDVAQEAARRGAKVVPVASHRFREHRAGSDDSFDLPMLASRIDSVLGIARM